LKEATIQGHVNKLLEERGAFFVKIHGNIFQKAGTSDTLFCYRGLFGCIEVKAPGKKPTAIQWKRMKEVYEAGGFARPCWNREEAEELLDLMDVWKQTKFIGSVPLEYVEGIRAGWAHP
jgi:hypothetical protein